MTTAGSSTESARKVRWRAPARLDVIRHDRSPLATVSHKYGYGLMDAAAMVTLAEQWTNVPPQHVCQTPADTSDRPIPNGFGQKLEVVVETDACTGSAHEIRFLEHVQCRISLRFAPRGNLRIRLTSPSGTQSVLLFERPRDVLDSSFDDWPFMSVHFWGERAAGRWKLEILNAGNKRVNKAGSSSRLCYFYVGWRLCLYLFVCFRLLSRTGRNFEKVATRFLRHGHESCPSTFAHSDCQARFVAVCNGLCRHDREGRAWRRVPFTGRHSARHDVYQHRTESRPVGRTASTGHWHF